MTRSVPLDGAGDVAASHHAVLSRSQAAESGLTAPVLRRLTAEGVLVARAPNAFSFVGSPTTWHQSLAVAVASRPSAVVSHRAAARLHGLDGVTDDVIEVTVPRGDRLRMPGVVVHQVSVPIPAGDLLVVGGVVTTSMARTIVDLASVVDADVVERACDDFERRGLSLTWLDQVATRLHRPGQRGTKVVLAHVAARRGGGRVRGSWFERLIEECLRSPRLPPLVRQLEIRDDDGSLLARPDLAFPAVRLAIECHSRRFHVGTAQELADQRRENRATVAGWQFMYLGWADRETPARTRRLVEDAVARRAADLGLSTKWGPRMPL